MSSTPREELICRLRHGHGQVSTATTHETRTRWVVALTFGMMLGELIVGYATNSLALTADGWHMATHAGALGMAAGAYWFARTRAHTGMFSFGTGKVHALAGYTNAIVLALVALWMLVESIRRLLRPESISFREALPVAVLGLLVNLLSVKLLHAGTGHVASTELGADPTQHSHAHHEHVRHEHAHHEHAHHEHASRSGHDHNLRAAYLHVLADALTSVLAIVALLGGRYFGWGFLDAATGIVGGMVILRWSVGLCRGAARQLLDAVPSEEMPVRLRSRVEEAFEDTRVVDLHVWEVGPGSLACIISLAAAKPRAASVYRDFLLSEAELDHVTVEVHTL